MIEDSHYYLDGGTTEFIGTDQDGHRRVVCLTQHSFPQWGGVGWLYLDRYKVPRRGDTERAIVRLLHRCLAELKARPQESQPDERTVAEALDGQGAVIYGSPDLAEAATLSQAQLLMHSLEQVLQYVESNDYGKPPPAFEEDEA
jgi:hypothetical protein